MFIKIDKRTKEETIINSTDMTLILERDVNANLVDDTLTDMAVGAYEHRDQTSLYKYRK